MDENKDNNEEIKEYADGWITERKGTDAPMFLKAAFLIIPLGALTYFFFYMHGETFHSERGPLVQGFNKVSQTSDGFMYFVGALILIYLVILIAFAWRKFHD
ncbi:MAG: hypothetical protein JSS81_05720 [Acidobacteria bacterium]|nr:hypothetical protein [Acidobacteriota bacterium]